MATTLRSFINDMNQVVQQTKGQQALKLANGSCPDMNSYHRQCGRMEGMEEVVRLAREMVGQLESAAQDDGGLPEMPPTGAGQ